MMEYLQTQRTFWLSLLAGLVAGGILTGVNAALVWPYTNALADIELGNLVAQGNFDEEEFDAQLENIYYSQLYIPVIVGLAAGAGLGGVFVVGKIRARSLKVTLIVTGIAWFALYVIPNAKYPASPEATFDSAAAATYEMLLTAYTSVSGLTTLSIAVGFQKIKSRQKVLGAAAIYLAVMAGAFLAFPDYQSENDSLLPYSVVSTWRSLISVSMTIFWFALGLSCRLLWLYASRNNG